MSVVEPAYDDNSQLSDLWLIDTAARHSSRRLTSTRRPESGVTWSPDSRRIVFSAQRENDDVPQIYSMDLHAGGEAQRVTSLSGGARAPVFSHDGRHLAFVSLMYPQAKDDAANKVLIERFAPANRTRASTTAFRSAAGITGWMNARCASSCRNSTTTACPSAAPRDLLAGTALAASPGFAGRQTDTGEEIEIEFTPDNQSVVFGATTNRNAAAYAFTDAQLFVVGIAGGEPKRITQGPA